MKFKFLVALATLAFANAGAAEPPLADTAAQPAVMARLATKSLVLDLAVAGKAIIAVGERGHVLRSTDEGHTWQQMPVPASATLTAVYFVDERHGWAVGHDEVIVRTEDGGLTWQRTHFEPDKQKPLLDVWFADAQNGLAVGAYGTLYVSADGGKTWELRAFEPAAAQAGPKKSAAAASDEFVDEADLGTEFHLNAIARSQGGALYLGGEAGHLYRSDDQGLSWRELPSPYDGSFYGIVPLDGDALLAFGLRGNLFSSRDGGQTWSALESGTTQMLTAGVRDGTRIVVVGLAGIILVSDDAGASFRQTQQDDRKSFASVLLADGELILAGESGVSRLPVPQTR